jgi:hypothetical protein
MAFNLENDYGTICFLFLFYLIGDDNIHSHFSSDDHSINTSLYFYFNFTGPILLCADDNSCDFEFCFNSFRFFFIVAANFWTHSTTITSIIDLGWYNYLK